jgi:hypothetical protein
MNTVFANAIAAVLESSQGGTLAELRRFLVEKDFRAAFLRTVADEEVRYYWEKEFPLLRGNAQAPILTRLDAFLRPRLVRNIVANPGESLDFRALMDERKILLVKLAQGAIGSENAYLLGSLVLSKLQQLALSRQDVEAAARPPFFVYLDEFQHLVTPTTDTLLSGVRKFGLSLTLAHQNLTQLSSELVDSVLANAGTRICFRVGDQDARKLGDGFSFFAARDLQNLDTGQAVARVGRADCDFNLTTFPAPQIDPASSRARADEVIAASQRQWTTPLSPPPASSGAPAATIPVFAVVRPRADVPAPSPPSLGRGGQQHQYLQALIQRLGQDRGFKATVEQSVLEGSGSVDVTLERDELRLAFEITVTTPTAHELANARKCLAAGFHQVVLVAAGESAVRRLEKAVAAELAAGEAARVRCLVPEMVPFFLDEFVAVTKTEVVAGYEVRVNVKPNAASGGLKAVREIISRSLKRKS